VDARTLLLAAALAGAVGCAKAATPSSDDADVKIEVLSAGKGPLCTDGQTVTVHYTGTFADGRKFDSSRDRNQPLQLVLGSHQVVSGWERTLAKMHVGDRVKATIPWTLAYGAVGRPPLIPPKTDLVFDMEVLDAR
jgi:FKBP-type peptidyl-prolyl cis-trans isomerase